MVSPHHLLLILMFRSRRAAQKKQSSLGEYKLRDLNDDINKLVREKGHWEDHIKTLGGPDFKAEAPKMLEKEGKEVPGNRGYRYYGAARDLPGVRELFEEAPIAQKVAEWKARREDPNFRSKVAKRDLPIEDQEEFDEDTADLRNIYAAGDNPADDELMRLYEAIDIDEPAASTDVPTVEQLAALGQNVDEDEEDEYIAMVNGRVSSKTMSSLGNVKRAFVAHVPVFTQEQIEASLLAQRKREILEKYMSSDLIASMAETGEILGMEDGTIETNPDANAVDANDFKGSDVEEEEEEDDE
ncbi:hypothetical protein T265_00711 [Opisthorchis viverrini]|uniref:Isy1-like splicing family protein n=2 Tax=Opisthorchis viverrini TaxID=6198 RepID=A0A075ABZ8_OPIVI|nr:hypothetical protein T265_00711 [Opisthorchis viverrini]KER33395.1 hypothetical protein T265_00711 [Opisthorchis viverrini]